MNTNNFWRLATIFVILSGYTMLFSYPSGVSGYTKKTGTAGCGCHGSSYFNTTVLVRIVGPDTVKVNTTTTYQVIVSGGPSTKAGVDIAAQNGILTAVSSYLKKSGTELTHTASTNYSNNQVIFEFKLSTGATTGTETLYATGSSKKYWNFATNKTVTVVGDSPTGLTDIGLPAAFTLGQNYPNPFNPSTVITFSLAMAGNVSLELFTASGEKAGVLASGYYSAGQHSILLNADKLFLASGTYIYRLVCGNAVLSKKLIYMR